MSNFSYQSLEPLFHPRSIALVGITTTDPEHWTRTFLDSLLAFAFDHPIYLVNPRGGEILGYKVYKDVTEVDGDIDLVVITVPAKYTFDTVKACGKQGKCKHLAIITSGFSEVGNEEEEIEIVKFAREHNMRVLGPNIFGVMSASAPANATFGPKEVQTGGVAILTQSGALGIALMGKTITEGIGLSAIVSIGNKADVDDRTIDRSI